MLKLRNYLKESKAFMVSDKILESSYSFHTFEKENF